MIANLHVARDDKDKALQCRLQALALREKLPDSVGLATNLEALGYRYFGQDDHDRALSYFQRR